MNEKTEKKSIRDRFDIDLSIILLGLLILIIILMILANFNELVAELSQLNLNNWLFAGFIGILMVIFFVQLVKLSKI